MSEGVFIKSKEVWYPGVISSIKKSPEYLQPLFEAFTNSLESFESISKSNFIKIKLHFAKRLIEGANDFKSMEIIDNGEGFNKINFGRLRRFKDTRKGHNNRGTGRIQYLHFFRETQIYSNYFEEEQIKNIQFALSKSPQFLNNDSIIKLKESEKNPIEEMGTTTRFLDLLETKDQKFYNTLSAAELKQEIIQRYLEKLCSLRGKLPKIEIVIYIDNQIKEKKQILNSDIPAIDSKVNFKANYYRLNNDSKEIEKSEDSEQLTLKTFKIESENLKENAIRLTSKNEIINSIKLGVNTVGKTDIIDGNRYLFLISGKYIDERDSDTRGDLRIPASKESYKNSLTGTGDLFNQQELIISELENVAMETILKKYPEIAQRIKEQNLTVEELEKMFLLNGTTVEGLKIGLNDSETTILEKAYTTDAKRLAKSDIEIKRKIETINELDPTKPGYQEDLRTLVENITEAIPNQNKTALSQYIARRKLLLDLMQEVLGKRLEVQINNNRNIDEKILHNLIFQQSSEKPDESDLWIIDEEFIYFRGESESRLGNIKINGEKIFKEDLSEEESKYRFSLGEDRFSKRTDVLLFPEESKCVIIEFKNPEVNLSEHINQINRYASLIRNLTKDKFNFETFYGYLIGEKLDGDDIRDFDSSFQIAHNFDYVFRPSKPIVGKFKRRDGSIYMEVITYSTLLKRAKLRNQIFIDKLMGK